MSKFALTSLGRHHKGTLPVKHVLLLGLAALMLAASVPTAEAVVCARGIYRAGCVGPRGGGQFITTAAIGVRACEFAGDGPCDLGHPVLGTQMTFERSASVLPSSA